MDYHEITVSFLGPVRRPAGLGQTARIRLPAADATVRALLRQLDLHGRGHERLQILMGSNRATADDILEPDQAVTIFLPLGGG